MGTLTYCTPSRKPNLPGSTLGALQEMPPAQPLLVLLRAPESSWMLVMKSGALLEHSGDVLLLHCSWELLSAPELILSQNLIFTPCACRELCHKTSKLSLSFLYLLYLLSFFSSFFNISISLKIYSMRLVLLRFNDLFHKINHDISDPEQLCNFS